MADCEDGDACVKGTGEKDKVDEAAERSEIWKEDTGDIGKQEKN